MKKYKINKSTLYLISLIMLISVNILSVYMLYLGLFDNGFTVFLVSLVFVVSILIPIFKKNLKIKKSIILMIFYILIMFFISFIRLRSHTATNEYFLNFLLWGPLSIYIGSKKIKTEPLLRVLSILNIITLFFLPYILRDYSIISDFNRIEMGISYALMPLCIASFIHFMFYRNKTSLLIKISYIANAVLTAILIIYGTRGLVLSFAIFILVLTVINYDKKENKVSISFLKLTLLLIFIMIVVMNFKNLVLLLQNTMDFFNIKLSFIEKSIQLIETQGNLFNFRIEIFQQAINGIKKNPLFGFGIGSFNLYSGEIYVHNIFLDLFYEMGILFSLPILFITLKATLIIFFPKKVPIDYYLLLLLLYISSVPRLLFSASFWSVQIFWITLGVILGNKNNLELKDEKN